MSKDTGVNAPAEAGSPGLTAQVVAKDAHDGSTSARGVPAPVSHPCGCKAASTITNQKQHDAWHALVVEQGGPAGLVDGDTLREARGFKTGTLDGETIIDVKARQSGKRASGALRRACE